jgi:hypothetical protein
MLASSEIDFDFDDVVVDSAVYRRVLAAAKRQGDAGKRPEINTDLVGNIGSGPMGKESITVATRVRSKQPSWQPANDQTYRGRLQIRGMLRASQITEALRRLAQDAILISQSPSNSSKRLEQGITMIASLAKYAMFRPDLGMYTLTSLAGLRCCRC